MGNYACAFSQSESGKYFEWIIRGFNAFINITDWFKFRCFLNLEYLRESDIEKFSSLGSVLIMGDFNSRVGKHPDSVCQEGNKIITNDFSESSLCATQRKSFDNDLNNHGKRLLEICRSADLRILNGRINGDSLGRPTFHGKSGISVIDYSLCDQDLLRNITSFVVKEPNYQIIVQ